FVALDFVLRVVFRGVPQIALMGEAPAVHLDDFAAHAPGFRVPADVAADPEFFSHCRTRLCRLFTGYGERSVYCQYLRHLRPAAGANSRKPALYAAAHKCCAA